jgi:hypothetical protein
VEVANSSSSVIRPSNSASNSSLQSDSSSDICNGDTSNNSSNNGLSLENEVSASNGKTSNGDCTKVMNGNSAKNGRQLSEASSSSQADVFSAVEQLLAVGRDLQALSISMQRLYGHNETNKKLLENAFSLLAYADPWDSPVGWQLSPRQREPVCAALNSAILQSIQLPRTPPLQVAINHAHLLLSQKARSGLGACAFVDLDMQADIK